MGDSESESIPVEYTGETVNSEYATPEYEALVAGVSKELAPNHDISYVPLTAEQRAESAQKIKYVEATELPARMAEADLIICLSRDEDINPEYTEANPERNISLTLSGASNVEKAVELFKMAQTEGNSDITVIATGRMHNRAVRMMLALPALADLAGLNAEDAYHISEARFKELLDEAIIPEALQTLNKPADDPHLAASYKAVCDIIKSAPTAETAEEFSQQYKDTIFAEFQKYPRVSTSQLIVERAVELGVPRESIVEEDGAVDTITNFVFTAQMIESDETLKDPQNVVIVAGSDHLPRSTWIADHVLPDGPNILCVEADPRLSEEQYKAECIRELISFGKGREWIGGTRELEKLEEITEVGYFSVARKDTLELQKEISNLNTK